MLGAAIGGAVHSQVGALVGALVWMFVVEPICWVLLGLLGPGRRREVPAQRPRSAGQSTPRTRASPFAGSVGMTIAWVAVLTVLALVRTGRRDIT